MGRFVTGWLPKAISAVGLLGLWWLTAAYIRDEALLPTPVDVAGTLVRLVATGELWVHLAASMTIFVYGLALAVVVGVGLAIFMGMSPAVTAVVMPWIAFLNATPRIGYAPLLVLWLGLSLYSYTTVVFLGAVIPILLNTYTAIKTVDADLIEMAYSFGASRVKVWRHVVAPAALLGFWKGFELAIGRGLVGIAVAEWFGAQRGLGFLVYRAGQTFQMQEYFAGVFIFMILGIISFALADRAQVGTSGQGGLYP